MKKFLPFVFLLSFFVCACTTGLGEEVDLEAPELTIESPTKLDYVKLDFLMTGTCKDNKGITDVVISNKETGKVYGYADITGETWSFNVHLEKEEEGEVTLLCTANDAFKNASTKSARTITLLADEHAPEGLSWYVDRGNSIQTPLKEKEFLENLDFDLAVNKDYPQNQKFTVYGNFYDAMSISTITLKLYEDETCVAEKTVTADPKTSTYIGDGKSIYSPSFEFTSSDFTSLGNGKHYLRVGYYARDNDSVIPEYRNEITFDTELYILWYPESDNPNVQHSKLENGKLSASVGSSIPLDFFDDDGLREIKYSLRTGSSWTVSSVRSNMTSAFKEIKEEEIVTQPAAGTTFSNDTTRDVPVQIKAPEIPGQMQFIAYAKDIYGKETIKIVPVEITDSQKPLLFIESPSENTIPTMMTGSKDVFQIKGYSLDTKGSKYIAIIYNPEGTGSQESAQKFFEDNKDRLSSDSAKTPYIESSTGKALWYETFTTNNYEGSWNKQSFAIEMDIMKHFKDASGKSTAADRKFFEIILMDSDNNVVYKPFILNGDSTNPTIEIVSPESELFVHDYTQKDLLLKFKGVKTTGLGMNEDKYQVETKIGSTTYTFNRSSSPKLTVTDGYANVTIPKETLKEWANIEAQPTFTFYATDKLGNGGKGEGQRSIILSPRPVIESITVDKNSGTYKAGDLLKFKVTFSKQVKVTGIPQLLIKYSSSSEPVAVNYTEGTGSNALLFNFTVPEGAESNGIICTGLKVTEENKFAEGIRIQATELGEGDIYTANPAGKVLADKEIKLDGVAPTIASINVQDPDGTGAYTKDKQLTAVITMSENVLVSGSPTLVLKVGSSKVNFSFQKMSGKEITFVHTITSVNPKDPEGVLLYDKKTAFSSTDAGYITDKTGNKLNLSGLTSSSQATSVSIDYTAPSTTPTTNLTADVYNSAQTITLSNIESGATAYFSINGGVSWNTYDASKKMEIGDGVYKIVTRQSDKAGNMSANSVVKTVEINSKFAPVTGFSIDLADGNYKKGTKIGFTLDFDQAIRVPAATDVKLTFASIADPSKTKTINTKTISNETTSVKFEYTTTDGDFFNGVKVTQIEFVSGFKDVYGNSPAFSGTPLKLTPTNCTFLAATDGGNRANIVLDSVLPVISSMLPAMNGSSLNGTSSGISTEKDNSKFKITINFAENVYKETGSIILQRTSGWAIPAVIESDEFLSLYNKMSAENQTIMMRKDSKTGKELVDGRTGIAVGPYRKITQGLVQSGTGSTATLVPDESTKYVLAYDLDLYTGSASLNNGTATGSFTVNVSDIRSALESVDYHRHKVDVAGGNVKILKEDGKTEVDYEQGEGGKIVEITFNEVIEDGREWALIIPAKAFRDNSENFYKGMNLSLLKTAEQTEQSITEAQKSAEDKYSVWSNNVATPVVRVDRYTHGWGATEPSATGTLTTITADSGKYSKTCIANSAARIAPTGYARARIDCETPGVTIKYQTKNSGTTAYDASGLTNYRETGTVNINNKSTTMDYYNYNRSSNKNAKVSDISFTITNGKKTGGDTYTKGNNIIVGDQTYTSARKDYISCYATKTGFEESEIGVEGIFRTVVYIHTNTDVWYENGVKKNDYFSINIEGGTSPGGQPNVDGFPLRDATNENDRTDAGRYSKNAYNLSNRNTPGQNFVFVSYEIISSDWAILVCRSNHAQRYPLNSYGDVCYIKTILDWNNGY